MTTDWNKALRLELKLGKTVQKHPLETPLTDNAKTSNTTDKVKLNW